MNIVSDYNPSQEPTPVYMKKKRTSTHIHNLHADLPIGHDWFRVFAVSVLFPFFVPATSSSSVLGFLAPITTTTTTAAADEGGFGAGEAGRGFDVFGLGVGEHYFFFFEGGGKCEV